jgi:hypothetical protein
MCYYFEVKVVYKECEKSPKHINTTTKYDRCSEAIETGYPCVDAKPAKGKNGEVIQMASTARPGKCPKCLS